MDSRTIELFRMLWAGGSYAFLWTKPGRKSWWFKVSEMPRQLKDVKKCVYFGVHPTGAIPQTNARGEKREPKYVRSQMAYIRAVNCLFADFDAKMYGGGKDEALAAIRMFTPPASVIVDSGGGYHGYWLLDATLLLDDADTLEYARKLQWRWVKHVGGDKGAKDLCRVLRVPGSTNYKEEYAPDFPRVEFERWLPNAQYSLHELVSVLPPEPRKRKSTPFSLDANSGDKGDKVLEIACRMVSEAIDGTKHYELLKASRLAGGAIASGWIEEHRALNALEAAISSRSINNQKAAFATIEAGIRYGKAFPLRSD